MQELVEVSHDTKSVSQVPLRLGQASNTESRAKNNEELSKAGSSPGT